MFAVAAGHAIRHEGETTMKKIKKLGLEKETLRSLAGAELGGAAGGLSANVCSVGLTGCGLCRSQQPSLAISNCGACATDICSFDACNGTIVVIQP